MDRKRNIGNRNRPQRPQRTQKRLATRQARLARRNRRQGLRPNRNRLSRAQNNLNRNRRGPFRNRRRFNNFRRRNLRYKIIFVGNLPFDVTSRRLRQLFRVEGRIFEANRGILGILFGYLGGELICFIMSKVIGINVVALVTPQVIIAVTLFSAAIGIFFGIYPAKKAAKLNPIEALRQE